MKAIVELVYEDADMNRRVEVEIKSTRGPRLLDVIDKAIEKQFKGDAWTRWNLISVEEDFA